MEVASAFSAVNRDRDAQNETFGVEFPESGNSMHVEPLSALQILREAITILRYNSSWILSIIAVLICPVSAVFLTNVLVNQSMVNWLSIRLLLLAKASGLPLDPLVNQFCENSSEYAVSIAVCSPLFTTLLLLSKAAIIYAVDCFYSKNTYDQSTFYVFISKIWKRVFYTYLFACGVICGCFLLFIVILAMSTSLFLFMQCPPDLVMYPVFVVGLFLAIVLAISVITCKFSIVISTLEDARMIHALRRSYSLVRSNNQVALTMFIGSTLGIAFVMGLFDHRVKTVSYGDGSSRIWEGPLLVILYSFILSVDWMMNTIFYFSFKEYNLLSTSAERQPVLPSLNVAAEINDAQ